MNLLNFNEPLNPPVGRNYDWHAKIVKRKKTTRRNYHQSSGAMLARERRAAHPDTTTCKIEIRKLIRGGHCNLLIVVSDEGLFDGRLQTEFNVQMSQNGIAMYTYEEFAEIQQVIQEAKEHLKCIK
jgi:hypothetical protein